MPPREEILYSVQKTTFWFAIASIILTVSLVLIVLEDHDREWKKWQTEFVKLEREKVAGELEAARAGVDQKKIAELQFAIEAAEAEFSAKQVDFKAAQAEKAKLDVAIVTAVSRFQDLKQFYDSYKYFFEEHREHGEEKEAAEFEAKMDEVSTDLQEARLEKEEVEKRAEMLDARIVSFRAEEKRLEKEIKGLLREQEIVEKKLSKLEPSIVKKVLNAPMLDFVAPSLQIQQVVLEDLHDDFYFAKAQKVDRCTSCHLAIDRKGFEDAPQPFRSHPNLELFLSSSSPHPLESIGCTVCHGGSGQSLSFTWAAHTPQNEEQKKEWEKKYNWHELHKWEAKMLPLNHAQASCAKCHSGVVNIPGAPRLNEGRNLAQASGCFGCHVVKGFEDRWKVGPDLRNVASKLNREWMVKWLQDPKSFRESTKMPRIFHLENTNSDEDRATSNTAIEGIVTYLLKNSDTVELTSPPEGGSVNIGRVLVNELGCLGCHSVDESKANDHGPELNHMGSKVQADWLFSWLKDPKHYAPETRMPSLRLTDEEAAHVTAYLLQSKNNKFEEIPVPNVESSEVDDLALDYLTQNMRRVEAEAKLSEMDFQAKHEFIGGKMIQQQGCFGCHEIKGFETTKRIGTELTKEGQKEVDKLDFGFVHIPHSRQEWFTQKLKNPRIFDRGKVKGYHEKLRMPDFEFTDEEAEALTTFLLSLRVEDIPLEMSKQLDLKEQEIEAGRLLVSKLNCQGCHTLDGVEGRAQSLFEDPGNAPPVIDGEGAKVQEAWLYHFLQNPEIIRPWLKYRMPTFGLNEEEANMLVKYFANLDEQEISFARGRVESEPEMLAKGKQLFEMFRCVQCHQPGNAQALTASFLAPELEMSKERLKPAWVIDWMWDPQLLQEGTMMPTFFPDGETPVADILDGDAKKQIKAIRDYLWTYPSEPILQAKEQQKEEVVS